MPLLVGEPGSGKTTRILEQARRRLRAGAGFRLIVPTATLAEHLRNLLAREGFLVPVAAVTTIAGFAQELAPELAVASGADLQLLTAGLLEERSPECFAGMAKSPGLAPAVAGALEELANAGCGALQWAALWSLGLQGSGLTRGLTDVYESLEEALEKRGLVVRARQLAEASQRVREGRSAVPEEVYFDGFFTFGQGELRLLEALGGRTRLTVALPEWRGSAEPLAALRRIKLREERLRGQAERAEIEAVAGLTREREVEEIVLRLLEWREAGGRWRDCAVVTRSAEPYVGLVTAACARAGIPVRSYFAQGLETQAAARLFEAVLAALESGWEWGLTAAALGQAVADCEPPELDGLVREALPGEGLEGLRRLAGRLKRPERVLRLLDECEAMSTWREETAAPEEWARRLTRLARWLEAPRGGYEAEELTVWRRRAGAARLWLQTVAEGARLLGPEAMLLSGFLERVRPALAGSSLRTAEPGREAVHLMDAHEARQWRLKRVFVCGLVEGEFPRTAQPDPVLGDELRYRLKGQGVPVKTRAEREEEEQFLFEFALTRATERLTLSWPRFDAEGRPMLRTFRLDEMELKPAGARGLRLRPERLRRAATAGRLRAEGVVEWVRSRHPKHRPTSLEVFLNCPFQFFARRTLKVEELPALPAERLDALAQGTLAHDAIAGFHRGEGAMEELVERNWQRMMGRLRIPASHRTEMIRLALGRNLRGYERNAAVLEGWAIEMERELGLEVAGAAVSGRADRVDLHADGLARVFEFKYSTAAGIKRRLEKIEAGLILQGGLYLAALREAGYTPYSLHYVGLRGETFLGGYEGEERMEALMGQALAAAAESIGRIEEGEIEVKPADEETCQYCEFRDACRVKRAEGIEEMAG